jgi:hypothetical protein
MLCPPLVRKNIKIIDLNPERAAITVKEINEEQLPPPREEPPTVKVHKELSAIPALITGCANFVIT